MGIKNMVKSKLYYKLVYLFLVFTSVSIFLIALLMYILSSDIIYKKNDIMQTERMKNNVEITEMFLSQVDERAVSLMKEPILLRDFDELNVGEVLNFHKNVFEKYYNDDIIDSMYIYYEKSKKVVSSDYNTALIDDFEDNGWAEYINDQDETNFKTEGIYRSFDDKEYITYLYSFPFDGPNKGGTIIINVDKNKLFRQFKVLEDEFVMVLDKNKTCIYGNDKLYSDLTEQEKNLITEVSNKNIKINDDEYVLFSMQGASKRFHYVTGIKLLKLNFEISRLRNVIILIAFLIFIVSIIFLNKYIKIIYEPLRNISKKIITQVGKEDKYINSEGDEIENITAAFDRLMEEKYNMEEFYKNSKQSMLQHSLINLCSGMIDDETEIIKLLEMTGFPVTGRYYTAMVIQISDKYNKNSSISREFILNLNHHGADMTTMYMDKNQIAMLISAGDKDLSVIGIAEQVHRSLLDEYNCISKIGVGNTFDTLMNYHISFKEATDALMYQNFFEDNNISHINDYINKGKNCCYNYPYDYEIKFIEAVKLAQQDTAIELFNQIYSETKQIYTNIEYLSMFLWQIINYTVKTLLSLGYEYDEVYDSAITDDFDVFTKLSSIEQMREYIEKKITIAINFLIEKRNYNNDQVVRDIKKYVDTHYMEDISLDTIAQKVQLSNNYVSNLFKKTEGMGLRKYITYVRMCKACELLENTTMNVSEIANQAGYENTRTFLHNFKTQFGITPTEYRKQHNESASRI